MTYMTDDEYIAYELNKAAPEQPGDVVRIKATVDNGGDSRWTSIPADRYPAVVAAASGAEAPALRALYMKLCDMHMDAVLTHGAQVGQGLAMAIKEVHDLLPEEARHG